MQPSNNYYTELISNFYTPEEELALLDVSMPDDKLIQMLRTSLDQSEQHWNQAPWSLEDTDQRALPFIFNSKPRQNLYEIPEIDYSDNRVFRGMRSIRAYVTSRLAMPDLSPSSSDDYNKRQAKMIALALYQHTLDEHVDQKLETVVMNHFFRKRGYLKLRFDPMAGVSGDVVTDVVPPEDLVMDKYATFQGQVPRIHQRVRCSLDELIAMFPEKEKRILSLFSIRQGRFTQMSREVTYIETWFTYLDAKRYPREGVAWWLNDPGLLVLDKQPNPNWIYTGDDMKDRRINLLVRPPKPFFNLNYLNLGRTNIDEVSLFDHAYPQQQLLDRRQKQWHKNIDYVNGRWIADKNKLSEGEATKMVNKGARTIGMIDNKEGKPLNTIFANVGTQPLPGEVYQSILDTRNEIDDLLGINSIFKGSQPGKKDTLGRDLLQNQQASSLQDDYVKSIAVMMQQYYAVKLQMMRTYWTSDQTIQTKGSDGDDLILILSGATIDPNIKIGVNTDSVLPINKAQMHQDAKDLFVANKLDALSAYQDMGYDDAEVRAERLYKSQLDPQGYALSVERGLDNNEAEQDIQAILHDKDAQKRDSYGQEYLDYYNLFVTTNRFAQLEPQQKQAIIAQLSVIQHMAATQAGLQQTMLDEAAMMAPPPAPVLPGQPGGGQPPVGQGQPAQAGAPSPQLPMVQ